MARQYISKLGKVDAGIVSVNAYGVLEGIAFPLPGEVCKPRLRLRGMDSYMIKPQLALQLIRRLKQLSFPCYLALVDRLDRENNEFLEGLAGTGLGLCRGHPSQPGGLAGGQDNARPIQPGNLLTTT